MLDKHEKEEGVDGKGARRGGSVLASHNAGHEEEDVEVSRVEADSESQSSQGKQRATPMMPITPTPDNLDNFPKYATRSKRSIASPRVAIKGIKAGNENADVRHFMDQELSDGSGRQARDDGAPRKKAYQMKAANGPPPNRHAEHRRISPPVSSSPSEQGGHPPRQPVSQIKLDKILAAKVEVLSSSGRGGADDIADGHVRLAPNLVSRRHVDAQERRFGIHYNQVTVN